MLVVSGSIAAFKAAALASRLGQEDYSVQVILTSSGRYFIGEGTFEGLTGHKVLIDIFEPGRAMDHIHLIDWADLILAYPCSASLLARLRTGSAADLASCLFLANNFRKPWWLAPAMNSYMFAHPAVAEHLNILSAWGCHILPTAQGRMACGDHGQGRLIEPETLAERIMETFG